MKVQNVVFPPSSEVYPKEMFFRGEGKYDIDGLHLKKGETASFDTFYNAIQPAIWRIECGITDLCLRLAGHGKITICFYRQSKEDETEFLGKKDIELSDSMYEIPVPCWADSSKGIVFFSISAREEVSLFSSYFWTNQPKKTNVKLGLVITHYNRQKFVIPAAKRLVKEIIKNPDCSGVSLVIVDNSQNLKRSDFDENVIIIKNKNTGGSGGFARGLLYLKDNGFTHCNFMDDDASCLTESIKRSYAFFSFYCGKDAIGLNGILLRDREPNIVNESCGGWRKVDARLFDAGRDVLDKSDLIAISNNFKHEGYGAWCYFGFKISDITKYPFPFFIRGDDILFSLQNKLIIISVLGISTCVDSFANKENALTIYLALRSHFVISVFMEKSSIFRWWRRFVRCNRAPLYGGFYSWSYGARQALQDILSGDYIFRNDVTGEKFRNKIKLIPEYEKMCMPSEEVRMHITRNADNKQDSGWRRVLRVITLNYLFCPKSFMHPSLACYKNEGLDFKRVCGFYRVYWFNNDTNIWLVTTQNKKEILKGIFRNYLAFWQLLLHYYSANAKLKKEIEWCTTEEFWRSTLFNTQNRK